MAKTRNRIGIFSLGTAALGFLFVVFQPWFPLDRMILFSGLSLKRLLEAFFDASLVGALADWFAVTALFKNPLGVKLRHTNILARNKDAIAEAVPRFLTGFVSQEKITGELSRVDFAARVAELLGKKEARAEIHDFMKRKIPPFLSGATSPAGDAAQGVSLFIKGLFDFLMERIDPAAGAASLLRWARSQGVDERLIRSVALFLGGEVGNNRKRLADFITPMIKKNAGWRGLFVGRSTVERLMEGMETELERIHKEPENEVRKAILHALESYAARLAGEAPDPDGVRGRLASSIREVLNDPAFQAGCARFLTDLLARLGTDLTRADSSFIQGLERVEDALQTRLDASRELRARF